MAEITSLNLSFIRMFYCRVRITKVTLLYTVLYKIIMDTENLKSSVISKSLLSLRLR